LIWRKTENGYTVVRTVCGAGSNTCYSTCGMLLYIKDGKLVKVEGDKDFPLNQGRLCVKALALPQLVHHPNRLTYPMKRIGERGEGKWQIISWDEAFDTIARKLKEIIEKYGPHAILTSSGAGRGMTTYLPYFTWAIGSPNWACPMDLCFGPKAMANILNLGTGDVWPDFSQNFPDRYRNPKWKRPNVMLLWGRDLPGKWAYNHDWIIDCMKMGMRLIVVDPRCTWIASRAEYWLQVRPGTDGALALSMLNTIIGEGLHDKEFVEKWTNAPFLVRAETRKLLREKDVKGTGEGFVVYDETTKELVIWDRRKLEHSKPVTKPLLEGEVEVKLADGKTVKCKPVWQLLKERVSEYPPEKVSEITGVPKDKIMEAARFLAKNKPATMASGVSIDQQITSVDVCRTILMMLCLTGNYDIPGGIVPMIKPFIHNPPAWGFDLSKLVVCFDMVWGYENLPREQIPKTIGLDKYPLMERWAWAGAGFPLPATSTEPWKAILSGKPYEIKALLVIGGGFPLCSYPDISVLREVVKKLEFIVVADILPSPMTEIADIVLPSATIVERDLLKSWYYPLTRQLNALKTAPDLRWDLEIMLELGRRLKPEKFPWKDLREFYDWCLKPIDMTWNDIVEKVYVYPEYEYEKYKKGWERPDGKPGFLTPTGKFEIWSTIKEVTGLDPLPYYEEPPESPITTPYLLKEYPLILTTGGRTWGYFHSEGRQIPWLRCLHPDPIVEMHPSTAAKYGIKEGDWVWIESRRGRCKMKAKLNPTIRPDTVRAEHNWWYPERLGKGDPFLTGVLEPHVNWLTSNEWAGKDIGSPSLRAMLCRVYKAD